MKFLILFLSLALVACVSKPAPQPKNYFLARVTFYTDCPVYGKKTASTVNAVEGTTVAAAKSVPFYTKYEIPRLKEWMSTDGEFVVHDRGPDVCKRRASKGKYPVIDVYVSSEAKVHKLGGRGNNIFKVYCK